jgi:hypothetical protein
MLRPWPRLSLRGEPGSPRDQTQTIARATFDGFLQSDLMPQGMQAPALIWAAAFLVGPAIFFPAQYLAKYPFIRKFHPERLERAFWDDRLLFLLMSAGAIGAVSVVMWDTLFPARRDAFVLTPLPVSLPVQMMGRLAGLVALCTAFVVALNGVPSITFPAVTCAFLQMPRAMLGHFVSTAAADAFVFFTVTSLQGVIILAFGRRAAARLSPVAQVIAVVAILLAILFIGGIRAATADALVRGRWSDPWLRLNPAAWFLGLYEILAGTSRPLMKGLALRAVVATLIPAAMTVSTYALGYHRLLRRAVETPTRSTRSWMTAAASTIVRTLLIRRPQEQAIAGFMLRAIARSGRHSLLMSIYIGAALAMMITFVLPDLLRLGPSAIAVPTLPALALPLVLSVGLAVGVRILITIPAEMPARWIFQTSAVRARRVNAATHKTLLLIVLPPVVLVAWISAAVLWNRHFAPLHAVFCGSLSLLLCEVLLIGYRGIPLTRPYVPGGSRFHLLWAFYLSMFLTYTFTSASLERELWTSTGAQGVLSASAIFGMFALSAWVWRTYKVRIGDDADVPFEADVPDDETFKGFNLSEIHAAQSVASRNAGERPM